MNKDFKKFAEKQEDKRILKSKGIETGSGKEIVLDILKCLFGVLKGILKAMVFIVGGLIKAISFLISQLINFIADKSHMKFRDMSVAKQNKLIRKITIIVLIIIIAVPSTIGILIHNNRKLADQIQSGTTVTTEQNQKVKKETLKNLSKIEPYGDVSVKLNIGSIDPGYYGTGTVRYKNSAGTVKTESVKTYGIAEFTTSSKSGSKYVKSFTDYVKSVDKDFYDTYFGNVNGPGTITFTTGWQDASTEEGDKFRELQFDYLYINYVGPTMEALEDEYKIDSNNNKIKELVYSTSIEYGLKGTLKLFKDAKITKDTKVNDIVTKVENQKIKALGDYTYTDSWGYSDNDRTNVSDRIEAESKAILKLK